MRSLTMLHYHWVQVKYQKVCTLLVCTTFRPSKTTNNVLRGNNIDQCFQEANKKCILLQLSSMTSYLASTQSLCVAICLFKNYFSFFDAQMFALRVDCSVRRIIFLSQSLRHPHVVFIDPWDKRSIWMHHVSFFFTWKYNVPIKNV